MSRVITQNVSFAATPRAVFDAIINGDQFSEATGGAPAQSSPTAGEEISLFGGKIVGRNLHVVPGELIVQAWRAANWGAGEYSIVRFAFSGSEGATDLIFEHVGFPEGEQEHLAGGWNQMYWEPLKAYLAARA